LLTAFLGSLFEGVDWSRVAEQAVWYSFGVQLSGDRGGGDRFVHRAYYNPLPIVDEPVTGIADPGYKQAILAIDNRS